MCLDCVKVSRVIKWESEFQSILQTMQHPRSEGTDQVQYSDRAQTPAGH